MRTLEEVQATLHIAKLQEEDLLPVTHCLSFSDSVSSRDYCLMELDDTLCKQIEAGKRCSSFCSVVSSDKKWHKINFNTTQYLASQQQLELCNQSTHYTAKLAGGMIKTDQTIPYYGLLADEAQHYRNILCYMLCIFSFTSCQRASFAVQLMPVKMVTTPDHVTRTPPHHRFMFMKILHCILYIKLYITISKYILYILHTIIYLYIYIHTLQLYIYK